MPRLLLLLLSALTLSEGRLVSRCELRDELLQRVQLPRNLRRNQERVMARVICEVERFSSLNTNLVREYEKEVINLDDDTTTAATAAVTTTATTTTTTATTTTTTTTAAAATAAVTTTAATTIVTTIVTTTAAAALTSTTPTNSTAALSAAPSSPEQHSAQTSSVPSTSLITTTTANSTAAPAPSASESTPPVGTPVSTPVGTPVGTPVSTSAGPADSRRRRALRQRRASVSVVSLKFFGMFQFSDRKFCSSGYSDSEDRCSSDCYVFADDDISDDVECFVQSNKFWEVFRGASSSCRSRRTAASFFEACEAGEAPPASDRVVARIFLSGGSYK